MALRILGTAQVCYAMESFVIFHVDVCHLLEVNTFEVLLLCRCQFGKAKQVLFVLNQIWVFSRTGTVKEFWRFGKVVCHCVVTFFQGQHIFLNVISCHFLRHQFAVSNLKVLTHFQACSHTVAKSGSGLEVGGSLALWQHEICACGSLQCLVGSKKFQHRIASCRKSPVGGI